MIRELILFGCALLIAILGACMFEAEKHNEKEKRKRELFRASLK